MDKVEILKKINDKCGVSDRVLANLFWCLFTNMIDEEAVAILEDYCAVNNIELKDKEK